MATMIHLVAETRNKAIVATTLHTMMNIHVQCMQRGVHLEIHFVDDKATLPKMIKTGERIFWMEYGTNLNNEILSKVFEPMPKGTSVLVFPSVKEGINWDQFAQKTKAGSTEPSHQRGLAFDTEVGRKLADGIYECTKTSARVWLMDAKPVDKKLRGGKMNVVLPLTDNEAMFSRLMGLELKIGVASEATVVCHFVHECFGNILEAAGVELAP
jgi:hypothetical protein